MIYDIYKDGTLVNTIVANEDFVVPYCQENGYTYIERAAQTPPQQPEEKTVESRVADLETSAKELQEALDMILTGVTE